MFTTPSNVLPLHLKQTFPPIIWIFIEGEGDGIESRLPFKIFSTLLLGMYNFVTIISWSDESQLLWESFARDRSESAFHALRKLRDLTIMEPCWLSHFFRVTILDFNLSFLFVAFCSFFPCSLTFFHRGRKQKSVGRQQKSSRADKQHCFP